MVTAPMTIAHGAPNRLASAPVWKPERPLTPHVKATKLDMRPLKLFGIVECNTVQRVASNAIPIAYAAASVTRAIGNVRVPENIIKNMGNRIAVTSISRSLCLMSFKLDITDVDSIDPAMPAD